MAFKSTLGIQVDRLAANHDNATVTYFTIAGGKVLITGLVGKITVESGANVCSWQHDPDAALAGTTALCGGLDINPALLGDLLGITGVPAGNMTYGGAVEMFTVDGIVLTIGVLQFIAAAADGASSWTLWYLPIDAGATVVATYP